MNMGEELHYHEAVGQIGMLKLHLNRDLVRLDNHTKKNPTAYIHLARALKSGWLEARHPKWLL
jgi:hypothetical protein